MNKYFLVVKNGVVINTIVVHEGSQFNFMQEGCEYIEYVKVQGSPGIGWTYDGENFAAPIVEEIIPE